MLRDFTEIWSSAEKKIKTLLTVNKKIESSKTKFLAKTANGLESLTIFCVKLYLND